MSIRYLPGFPADNGPADAAIANPRLAVLAVVRKWRLFIVI